MAVKSKTILCSTTLKDFNCATISGAPFYERYAEIVNVLKKYLPKDIDPDALLAEPVAGKGSIYWYVKSDTGKDLRKLTDLDDESRLQVQTKTKQIVGCLQQAATKEADTAISPYINCVLSSLQREDIGQTTFAYNGCPTFALWGMTVRKGHSLAGSIVDTMGQHNVHKITYRVEGHGKVKIKQNPLLRKYGHTLEGSQDIPEVIPDKYYEFVKWEPDAPQGKKVQKDQTYTAICQHGDVYNIRFRVGYGAILEGETSVDAKIGTSIDSLLPHVKTNENFKFKGWQPEIGENDVVTGDAVYTARTEEIPVEKAPEETLPEPEKPEKPVYHTVKFNPGENGELPPDFNNEIKVKHGECVPEDAIPKIKAHEGFCFTQWDHDTKAPIAADTIFTALYDKRKDPWYKRLWAWLMGFGCLKWLLWLGLLLLLILLLIGLFNHCEGTKKPVNGVVPADREKLGDGRVVDDNGYVKPIGDNTGTLPADSGIVAPVMGEGGQAPPVVQRPGAPDVIGNRLFLFMENEKDNVDALAKDFKAAYPGDQYSIIGYDREVKLLVIQIPENEREQIRQSINARIPNHKFFVFDEEIYELNTWNQETPNPANKGWHLQAIHLRQGWQITKGSPNVKVAVVDDGIDAGHAMFRGRITDAYNVFTQNNHLSTGKGHGTHTAALAAGSAEFYNQGASGMAPMCSLMPIQVFDNGYCPLSGLVAGVMYALHHGADVVNVSIGPMFKGLDRLPVEEQEEIARTQFKNVERLWTRVCHIAARKRSIIVFAAGNDNILANIPPENRNEAALVVAAVDRNMNGTTFTNYGVGSDISAPGKDIYSAFPVNAFKMFDGTSMAAPIVSGVVALMKTLKKDLTVEQARNVLQRGGAAVQGNVPPMVLADRSLQLVRAGDFSAPVNGKGDNTSAPIAEKKPARGNDVDVDAIRAQIREYEQKIEQLKRLLPNTKK